MSERSDFLSNVKKCQLLTEEQLGRLSRSSHRKSNPESIAHYLCQKGWLTRWQADNLLAGRSGLVVAGYALLEALGRGRMGIVYKARHRKTGKIVALKLVSSDVLGNATVVARFRREIKLISSLRHPNIVAAIDSGSLNGREFLVTEYVPGHSLLRWIQGVPQLPANWVCECIRQAALGVQHIHDRGLVHRDVKPANVMVTAKSFTTVPRVKLLDLGLGRLVSDDGQGQKLTRDGHTVGTIDFMAPEQMQSGEPDVRSDIYALGCTFFQALTRHLPFEGDVLPEKILKKLTEEAPRVDSMRSDLPRGLAEVIGSLLVRDPDKRIGSAAQVVEALAPFARLSDGVATGNTNSGPNPFSETPSTAVSVHVGIDKNSSSTTAATHRIRSQGKRSSVKGNAVGAARAGHGIVRRASAALSQSASGLYRLFRRFVRR